MKFSTLLKPTLLGLAALAVLTTIPTAHAVPVTWNGWTFDYQVGVNNDGLALENVNYNGHKLLKKIGLPIINGIKDSPYFGAASCELPTYDDQLTSPSAIPWASNASVSQRPFTYGGKQWLELGIYQTIASREYFQAYYLSQDGLFDAHLYSRNGWFCANEEIRLPNWRIDLDVDSTAADMVEETSPDVPSLYVPHTNEFSVGYYNSNPGISGFASETTKRVRDSVSNSAVYFHPYGFNFPHPDGTETTYQYSLTFSSFLIGLLNKTAEEVATDPFALANNENIQGQDGLLWHIGQLSAHNGYYLDEDENISATAWYASSMSLVPSWSQSWPDVVVDEVSYDYFGGNYTVTVRNLGTVTPVGKVVGVGIYVDGQYKTYVSTGTPLKAGEIRRLKTSILTRSFVDPGEHVVTVWVDDINRFPESNENNNKLNKKITISTDLAKIRITSALKNSTVSGASVVLSAKALNPTTNASIRARGDISFYIDDTFIGKKQSTPYTVTWDSRTVTPGWHSLMVLNYVYGYGTRPISGDSVPFYVAAEPNSQPPDLVVTSLNYANGSFTCTLKNVGTGLVPAQASIALAYYVDGVYRTWTATNGPLAAGESKTLALLGSPYFIQSGTHAIKVVADNQSSVAESNETNNQLSQTITVP